MIDTIKFYSSELRIHVTCSILLPKNYHIENKIYKPYYYLCLKNPFIKDKDFLSIVDNIDTPIIAIYPTQDLNKNILLFDIFNKNFDYAIVYLNFIITDLIKRLEGIYRFSSEPKNKTIIAENECAISALFSAHLITSEIENVVALNLNLKDIKMIRVNLLSLFNPNISISFSSHDREKLVLLNNNLKEFGIKKSEIVSDLTVLSYLKRNEIASIN